MSIATLANYQAAAKQYGAYARNGTLTSVAAGWFSLFHLVGDPPAGTLAVGNTANGLVPDNTMAGAMSLNAFGGSAYLTNLTAGQSGNIGRYLLYDRLFHAGAFNFNDSITLASQPSFSARVPGGTDFNGLFVIIEAVTAFTGNPSLAMQYTNAAGTAAQTIGTFNTAVAMTLGRVIFVRLAAGDNGIQKIEVITGSVASAGTFNVVIGRPLAMVRAGLIERTEALGLDQLGMPQIFPGSCIHALACCDSTTSPVFDLTAEIASN